MAEQKRDTIQESIWKLLQGRKKVNPAEGARLETMIYGTREEAMKCLKEIQQDQKVSK